MRWILLRGLVGSVLLVVAGLVYAHVPEGSRVRQLGVRHSAHHVVLGMLLALAGLVLLTWAWLALVRHVTGRPGGVGLARWAAATWTAPLVVAPPLFSRDGWSYVASGWLAGHGFSPYVFTPSILPPALRSGVDPVWRHTTSPYGPLPLLWGAAASHVTQDPWRLLVADRLLAYVGLVLLALAVPALAARAGRDPARASAVAIASPFVVAHGIGGLHHDLVMAGLVVAALAVTRRDRWFWGAVLVGLAASVKVPGAAVAVGVVLVSLVPGSGLGLRLRRSVEVGAVSLATLVLVSLTTLGLGWTHGLDRSADEVARLAPTALLGRGVRHLLEQLGPAGQRLVLDLRPEKAVEHLGLLALALLAAWVLVGRRLPRDGGEAVTVGSLVVLASVLLSPVVHYWYFLAPVALLAAAPFGRRGDAAVLGLAAALGLTAVVDPSMHVWWFAPLAVVVLVALPGAAWLAASRSPVGREPVARRTLGPR